MPSPRGFSFPAFGSPTRPQPAGFCCAVQPGLEKNVIRPPELQYPGHLPRTEVLRFCLALDDAALSWLCEQLFRIRTQVLEQVYLSNRKPEAYPAEETEVAPPTVMELEVKVEENETIDRSLEELEKPVTAFQSFEEVEADAKSLRQHICQRDLKLFGSVPLGQKPQIQFESPVYYCIESEPMVDVVVMRIGDVSNTSSVSFSTKDVSARAGVKYEEKSGTIVFAVGQRLQTISIATIEDSAWDATLEFKVELHENGLENGRLGTYFWEATVKFLDDDFFPSNRYRTQIDLKQWDNLNKTVLMCDFFRLIWRNPVVRKGLIKTGLNDQCRNVYFIMGLFLRLYMIDHVLCPDTCDANAAPQGLMLIVILYLAPFPLLHFMEYREAYWKVGGATRSTLQCNLLRKYLSYDSMSLQDINESELTLAMTRDSFELAANAVGKLPGLIGTLIRLFLIVCYQVITPIAFGENSLPPPGKLLVRFGPGLLLPMLMVVFLLIRNKKTENSTEYAHTSQNDMIHFVHRGCSNYDLLRDFKKRGWFVERFQAKVDKFNANFANASAITCNNEKFPEWLTLLLMLAYIVIGGRDVSSENLKVGEFLNNLAIYKALGTMWGRVYTLLLSIQGAFNALETIVEHMNLATETGAQMCWFRRNQQFCKQNKEQMLAAGIAEDPADALCIELRGLSFSYKGTGSLSCPFGPSSFKLPQGGLYVFVGPPSEGKATILKFLGQVLIPRLPSMRASRTSVDGGGDLIVPSHLRALHVSKDPMFMEGSLLSNLTFGSAKSVSKDSILSTCRKLQVAEPVLEAIADESLECQWNQVLSSTQAALLHIARALITGPELLCIHKPTLYLNPEMTETVYRVLREFVEHRGIEQDPVEFYARRPRTCIVTASMAKYASLASDKSGSGSFAPDAVYMVCETHGAVRLS